MPFSGMDPYLEAPEFWEDFRDGFIQFLKDALNQQLPDPLYAHSGKRTEIAIADGDEPFRHGIVRPDVAVSSPDFSAGGPLFAEPTLAECDESVAVLPPAEEVEIPCVEIRDLRSGHELVTVFEVLSPTNKRPSGEENRDAYDRKRGDLSAGRVSLVELDLLRGGDRGALGEAATQTIERLETTPEYVVLVTRGHIPRPPTPRASLFPAPVDRPLPRIAVPLRKGERELVLNLQDVFESAYAAGPYAKILRPYPPQPDPPLNGREEWLAKRLKAHAEQKPTA